MGILETRTMKTMNPPGMRRRYMCPHPIGCSIGDTCSASLFQCCFPRISDPSTCGVGATKFSCPYADPWLEAATCGTCHLRCGGTGIEASPTSSFHSLKQKDCECCAEALEESKQSINQSFEKSGSKITSTTESSQDQREPKLVNPPLRRSLSLLRTKETNQWCFEELSTKAKGVNIQKSLVLPIGVHVNEIDMGFLFSLMREHNFEAAYDDVARLVAKWEAIPMLTTTPSVEMREIIAQVVYD